MRQLLVIAVVSISFFGLAQGDLEARVAQLEQRLAQLEAMLAIPAPPTTTQEVEGFTFIRLNLRQTSIGLELVGEVISDARYDRVTFRVTFYAANGEILETDTFSVERVSTLPRTFDKGMFSSVRVDDVSTIAIQVERYR